jgi:putative transposase
MGKQRKTWTVEQQLTLILAAWRDERGVAARARHHGVSAQPIYRWKAQFLEGGREALGGAKAPSTDQRLQRDNDQRKQLLGEQALASDLLKTLSRLCAGRRSPRCLRKYTRRSRSAASCEWWGSLMGACGTTDERRHAVSRVSKVIRPSSTWFTRRHWSSRPMGTDDCTIGSRHAGRAAVVNECDGCGPCGAWPTSAAERNAGPHRPPLPWRNSPPGRRVPIDATRLTRGDGVTWVYVVEDVASRACLAVSVGRRLRQERAAPARQAGHRALQQGGLTTALVIQRDGGSECTSAHFQQCCQAMGPWVRCRVNQVGGMGVVERLNRTCKYDVVFRHAVTTSLELKALAPRFQDWYNQERLHSRLGYQTPWQQFLADAAVLT